MHWSLLKFLLKSNAIIQTNLCMQRELQAAVSNALDLCESHWKLCDLNILRLTNDLWRNSFRRADVHRRFAEHEQHLLYKFCFLLITFVSNRKFSTGSWPSNLRTFNSGMNLILNCKVIKMESCDRCQLFARTHGLSLFALKRALARLLQQKHNSMNICEW